MAFYWLFLTMIFPGIAHAKNATIELRNIEDMFHQAFKFGGEGIMWTTRNGYLYTCSNNGDYVFLTNKINITDTFTDTIYVTMKTSFSDNFNKSLKIYLHTGSQPPSTVDTNEFTEYFFENFSLIYSVENNTASMRRGDRWTHIFKFHKNESKIVTLAVRGIGVCARIYSIKVYYYFCKEINQRGVTFPKTISPFEGQKKVEVNCSVNSSPSSHAGTLTGLCAYNGTWDINREMGCICKKGFEQNSSNQCMPCRDNYFKPLSSNKTCKLCPAKRTNTEDRTSCKCSEGYYHLKGEPTTTPCFGPIEEKFDISVKKLDQKVVNISWQTILVDEKMSNSLRYDVECFLCENKDSLSCNKTCKSVEYKPRKDNLTQTFVRISELEPGNRYVFRVYPKTVINIKFVSKDHWKYSETRYLLPITTSTSNIPSTVKVTGVRSSPISAISVSTIALSVAVSILAFLLIVVLCGVLKYKIRGHTDSKDTIELRQNEFVEVSQNNEEPHYENPDELGIILHEEVPNLVRLDENRPNSEEEQLKHESEYATADDNGTELHEDVSILTRSVLAEVNEKGPDDPQKELLINDLVYAIPLDDQTKPHEGLIEGSEERERKQDDSLQSELLEDNDGYLLPADGETDRHRNVPISEPSAYTELVKNRQYGTNIGNDDNYQKLLKRYSDNWMSNDAEEPHTIDDVRAAKTTQSYEE